MPAGYQGPVAYFDDPASSCAGAAVDGGLIVTPSNPDSALLVPASSCTCSCDGLAACMPVFVEPGCDDNSQFAVPAGACANGTFLSPVSLVRVEPPSPSGCVAELVGPNIPAWSFAIPRDACSLTTTTEGCPTGELCVSTQAGASYCVYKMTSGDCSDAGPYTIEIPIVVGATDTRACDPRDCSCGTPTFGDCNGTVSLYTMPGCTGGNPATPSTDGTCLSMATATIVSGLYILQDPPQCPANTPAPQGGVTAHAPWTLCCRP